MEKNNPTTLPASLLEQVNHAIAVLREGGVVAYPTDTVYGLGADIYNDEAVRRVYAIKRRPLDQPLPVLIAEAVQAEPLTGGADRTAEILMKRFWPGGLTIIFNKSPEFNSLVLAGGHKIGVRIPDHALARSMIAGLGRPIVGTSANLHNRRPALTAAGVREQLKGRVDFILDGGDCPGGKESTVIDLTVEPPVIVRQGVISAKRIRALIKSGGS